MAVRGRLNVFTGWTYLIPEYRSDMLRTKIRPHIQMSQTRSPGASEMPLVYLLPYEHQVLWDLGVNLEEL